MNKTIFNIEKIYVKYKSFELLTEEVLFITSNDLSDIKNFVDVVE
jgi:hypothetical protein